MSVKYDESKYMKKEEALAIIKQQHYDILYLMLESKAAKNSLSTGGIMALLSMKEGLEDLPGQKFTFDDIDKRFKEISDFLDKIEVTEC